MSWLVWISGLRGPCPQHVFDGAGDQPFLEAGIASHVLAKHKLRPEEEGLSLNDLSKRYPPPDPVPAVPAPAPSGHGGAAAQVEVA